MSANNAHGGINSPGWEQMRLNKAREAQTEAENEAQEPDKKKILRNRIIAAVLILIFLAACAYFIFFAPIAPVNMG
ncbi:MAG: hypothetical protein K6A77_02990 [Clostridiales bacterium]|nr:hypothetical protein [Clostridiales bacterium]